nr:rab-like protein 3 isoform X1 [Microcebus murinus]
MASLDRVKVLVLGDSGVGKSSLVHLLCQNQVLENPSWTVGCSVDVRVHDYKEGTPEEKTYYIELWDVGGSVGSASSVKSTRAVFYNSVNGIILVHDLTNKKSSQNLYRWSLEALNRDLVPTGVLVTNGDYDREQFADNQIPLLVIGTKLDQIHETKRHEVLTRTAFLAEDFNAEEINLVKSLSLLICPNWYRNVFKHHFKYSSFYNDVSVYIIHIWNYLYYGKCFLCLKIQSDNIFLN